MRKQEISESEVISMEEQAKKAQRAYQKAWRERNRERVLAYKAKYREQHREQLNEYARKWRKENPDKAAAIYARYWQRVADREQLQAE